VGHLPLEVVTQGEDAIRQALQGCSAQLVVADAVEMEHLYALARAAAHMPQPWLCCGSAGLADGWLQALGFGRPATKPLCWAAQAGPALVVAGSRHPATGRQLHQAQEDRDLHVVYLALSEGEANAQWSQARRMLTEGQHVALTTAFSRYRPGGEAGAAAYLAGATAWVCATVKILGLILTGGDTADAVCTAMGMTGVQVVGEVQPGIPAASGIGGQGEGLRLVTKAGAFGDEQAIVRSIDFMEGEP
jgi:uncharacterized protein YgbK (DUF1537 family)